MNIAHLILTHKNPQQLRRLIQSMDHPFFDFYIHLDKKIDAKPYTFLSQMKNVFMIEHRARVYWAGYGSIQATLNGFREIVTKNYDYINVISAQDFPLKSPQHIYEYISDRAGKEFITCESIEDEWKEAAPRVKQYHLINWRVPGKYRLSKLANIFPPARKFPLDYNIVGRSNWFTLTNKAARYILDFEKSNPAYVRYFKYCWGADEFFFSTILFNSAFRNQISNNLIYVDWIVPKKTGHPKILGTSDFEKLKSSDKLFARKFDGDVDSTIITLLEDWIKDKTTHPHH
jgi:hypothetical protein